MTLSSAKYVLYLLATMLCFAVPSAIAQTQVEGEITKLLASDGAADDWLGWSVAISDDTAVIGAPRHDDNGFLSGSAYVYIRDASGVWSEQAELLASDGAAGDWFGWSVAISGDTAVVTAKDDDDNGSDSGAAYVYVRDASGVWSEQAKLLASDGAAEDGFGWSIAISDDTAVVGAFLDDDNGTLSGSAYVYIRDASGVWNEQAKLLASDGAAFDRFGQSVAISGETAVVGARGGESAYVYIRDASGVWSEQAKLLASDGAALEENEFGQSVAISGDTAVVGASGVFGESVPGGEDPCVFGENLNLSGSAYVYVRDASGVWSERAKLLASDGADCDQFGWSVAVSGDTAVVGSIRDDTSNGAYSGSAYVFGVGLTEVVTIDIKPGTEPNYVNLRAKGKIPVAILTTDTFDATQVDWETVLFGPDGATESHGRAHIADVDEDGDMDVLLHFKVQDTGITCGDTDATLTGETFGGESLTGTDTVEPKPCPEPDVGHIWRVNYTQAAVNSMNGKVETHVLLTDSSFASSGANYWNEVHPVLVAQTLMETSATGGGTPSITFVGQATISTVSGSPMSGEPIDDDLDNWAARFPDKVVNWEFRDLDPLKIYDLVFYDLDSLTASITLTTEVDSDGDGVLDQTDTIAWDIGDDFSLFQGVSPDVGGVIRGRWTGSSSSFVDVAGFQIAESSN